MTRITWIWTVTSVVKPQIMRWCNRSLELRRTELEESMLVVNNVALEQLVSEFSAADAYGLDTEFTVRWTWRSCHPRRWAGL